MPENRFRVLNEFGRVLAENMEWEDAVIFMRAYKDTYYREKVKLTIEEMTSYEDKLIDTMETYDADKKKPPRNKIVLVYIEDGIAYGVGYKNSYTIAFYNGADWIGQDRLRIIGVKYWRNIPDFGKWKDYD